MKEKDLAQEYMKNAVNQRKSLWITTPVLTIGESMEVLRLIIL